MSSAIIAPFILSPLEMTVTAETLCGDSVASPSRTGVAREARALPRMLR